MKTKPISHTGSLCRLTTRDPNSLPLPKPYALASPLSHGPRLSESQKRPPANGTLSAARAYIGNRIS